MSGAWGVGAGVGLSKGVGVNPGVLLEGSPAEGIFTSTTVDASVSAAISMPSPAVEFGVSLPTQFPGTARGERIAVATEVIGAARIARAESAQALDAQAEVAIDRMGLPSRMVESARAEALGHVDSHLQSAVHDALSRTLAPQEFAFVTGDSASISGLRRNEMNQLRQFYQDFRGMGAESAR